MVPQRKGSAVERAVRGVRERARQAKAFIKPAGKFLRRDSQLSIMAISIVSPGNQYSNSCRETSHQCYVHPRLQGLLGCWTGFPHLRTDLGPSPARGSSPIVLVAQGSRDEPIDPSITSFLSLGGWGSRGSAQYKQTPGGVRRGHDGGSTLVVLHAEACWGQSPPNRGHNRVDSRARPSQTSQFGDSRPRN